MRAVVVLKGGVGSGFYGHKGRPGEVGGSVSEGVSNYKPYSDDNPILTANSFKELEERNVSKLNHFDDMQGFGYTILPDGTLLDSGTEQEHTITVIQAIRNKPELFNGIDESSIKEFEDNYTSYAAFGKLPFMFSKEMREKLIRVRAFYDTNNMLTGIAISTNKIDKIALRKLQNLVDDGKLPARSSNGNPINIDWTTYETFNRVSLNSPVPNSQTAILTDFSMDDLLMADHVVDSGEFDGFDNNVMVFKESFTSKNIVVLKGGPGSGHFGHKGIPGHQGGSLPSDSLYTSVLTDAVVNYTNLVDYSKSDLVNILNSGSMDAFINDTQSGLKRLGINSVLGVHRTQNLSGVVNPYVVGQVIEIDDVFSMSEGSGPKEYSKYRYKIIANIPVSKIIVSSKITPELFPIKSEQEFITRRMKLRLGEIDLEQDIVTIHAAVVSDDTPVGGGVDKTDPDWWKYFRVEKQLPISDKDIQKLLNLRVNIFYDKSDKLSEQVFTGDLTIGAWEEAMRAELRQLHSSAAAIAKGGWDQMTSADWGRLGTPLREQYKYLHGFATTIAEQSDTISLKAIQARARMYGRATGNTAALIQAGAIIESLLPWIPGDGSTNCLVNCRCRWDLKIIKVDKKSGDKTVKAVWRLSPAEHCEDCLERNGHVEMFVVPKDTVVPKYIGRGVL